MFSQHQLQRPGAPLNLGELLTMVHYSAQGQSAHAIATLLQRDPSTISRNLKKYTPLIRTEPEDEDQAIRADQTFLHDGLTLVWFLRHFLLVRLIESPGLSVRKLELSLKRDEWPFAVGKTRINEELHNMHLASISQIRIPRMLEEHIIYRRRFVQEIKIDFKILLPWMFSDEASIDRNCHQHVVRRIPGMISDQSIYVEEEQFPMRIMVWGAISRNFKGPLMRVEGTLNSNRYKELITESGVIDSMNSLCGEKAWVFQDDGASPHRAKATRSFLSERCLILSSDLHWPAHSPDLNVIENVWGIIKSRMDTSGCQNRDDLWAQAQMAWNSISIDEINDLIDGFFSRLQGVEILDGRSLNGHHDVRRMLKGGHTVQEIIELRAQEADYLTRFKNLSNQFFRRESWDKMTEKQRILQSIEIIDILPERIRSRVGLTKDWFDLPRRHLL